MSGSSKETQTQTQTSQPWTPQAEALQNAFSAATRAFNTSSNAQLPTDFVAGFNPNQLATFQSMVNYGRSNNIPGVTGDTAVANQNAGTGATAGALSGLAGFDPSAATNPTTIVDTARRYMEGQNIDAQVNDAMFNARQTARDVTLPQIEQNAATSGNTDSSRTAIAQGLVQRGLGQQAASLGAAMRGKAFGDGLALASNNAQATNDATIGALSARGQLGNAATALGVNAGSSSIADKGALYGMENAGGAGQRDASQAYLDNRFARYSAGQNALWSPLQNYMSIIGSNNWGGTTNGTATKTSTPSAFQIVGGLLGGLGSAASTAGGLGYKPFA